MSTPGGTQADQRGNAKKLFGKNFLFWGIPRGTILIWGYAEGYNFDLGVRE